MPVDALDLAWDASTSHPVGWELAELGYWRAVAGLPAGPPLPLPEPFALMHEGRWRDAARAWQRLQCPLWQAMALGRAADLNAAREAFDLFARLDVPAVRAAVARDRHAAGLQVPRGPRAARAANPANLTARELEILGLLARHLSNAAIARELYLSDRTVEHHVSAILRKLGEPTRARAVSAATELGVLEPQT
jgi:DNA-binding CsgD family transcriptional regulator